MKKLFITGGTGEIGQAIAKEFQYQGYEVIAPNREALNLTDPASINHYMEKFTDKIDAFIHCAGLNKPKPFEEIKADDLQETLAINTIAFYQITQKLYVSKQFKDQAYVLGISSIYSSIARRRRFSYVASKHCLNGMVKTLAIELAPAGIKVNTLSPGFVATRMTYANNSPKEIENIIGKIPLGALAKPQGIAKAAHFLCSENNAYITGQNIIADGGYTIGGFE